MSISFGPDQWANLESLTRELMSGGSLAGPQEKTITLWGREVTVAMSPVRTSEGPVAVIVVAPLAPLPAADDLRRRFHLTPKEAEVALLMCEGRSNKEVAQRLHFKPKSAEKHAAKVLAKVGVGSRKDVLAAVMRASTL